MSLDTHMSPREEMDALIRKLRGAVDALADHHTKSESQPQGTSYDPNVHDQAWVDRLVELENTHRDAYEGLLSRWPQLLPELSRFKAW